MRGAIILGMRRSGSTLAFNLVRELLAKDLQKGSVRTTYADGVAADQFVETAFRTGCRFVLKTHASGVFVDKLIAAGSIPAIYTWRDPRDAIVSYMTFLKSTFAEAAEVVTRSLCKFEQTWRGYSLEISYPELYPLTPHAISRIANYLGIRCSVEMLNQLTDRYCIEVTHAFTRDPANFVDEFDFRYNGRRISRSQLWQEFHVQCGENGIWIRYLKRDQLKKISENAVLVKYFY